MKEICSVCEAEYDSSEYTECEVKNTMDNDKLCYHCAFWTVQLKHRNEHVFIIDGEHYRGSTVAKDNTTKLLGFSGSDFYVKFISNGRVQHYNNVWHQGSVPKDSSLANKFKDNARFISKQQYECELAKYDVKLTKYY